MKKLTGLAGWAKSCPRSSVVYSHISLDLKKHLPNVFVCCAEELQQGLVLGPIVLPQKASPAFAWKDPANKHHLDHIDKLDILVYHAPDVRLKRCQLVR